MAVKITQLQPIATPGRRYGSFAGKAAAVVWAFFGLPFLFDSANWKTGVKFVLEAYMRQTTDEIKMRLYDDTVGVAVANSEILTANATLTRVRSSVLSLTDGSEYRVQIGGLLGNGGDAGGKIVALL